MAADTERPGKVAIIFVRTAESPDAGTGRTTGRRRADIFFFLYFFLEEFPSLPFF